MHTKLAYFYHASFVGEDYTTGDKYVDIYCDELVMCLSGFNEIFIASFMIFFFFNGGERGGGGDFVSVKLIVESIALSQ